MLANISQISASCIAQEALGTHMVALVDDLLTAWTSMDAYFKSIS